jgi:hypothetical protein
MTICSGGVQPLEARQMLIIRAVALPPTSTYVNRSEAENGATQLARNLARHCADIAPWDVPVK